MTPLQQTLDTCGSVTGKRFRITVCTVFLLVNILQTALIVPTADAQVPIQAPATPVLSEGTTAPSAESSEHTPDFLTSRAFEDALEKELSLAWQGQNLRSGLQQLSATRLVAILLDRRIDPGREMSLQVRNVTLLALLNLIASEVHADVSVLGNVIYIGPRETALRLRTVEEIASAALVSGGVSAVGNEPSTSPRTRRSFELLGRQTLNWPDLTTPRELLSDIGRRYELQIESLERVPHDLWSEAFLPSATPTQMLLAVLAQFNLSFEWTASRDGIRIVDMPPAPRIERQFTLRAGTERGIVDQLNQRMPGLEPRVAGRRLTVSGTFEQLENVELLIYPERRKPRPDEHRPGSGITKFTFAVANAPLTAFMNTLQKQAGYDFQYDAEQLEKAGIRLDKPIRLEANELTAEELFHAMFDAQGIAFEIDEKVVHLKPADR